VFIVPAGHCCQIDLNRPVNLSVLFMGFQRAGDGRASHW